MPKKLTDAEIADKILQQFTHFKHREGRAVNAGGIYMRLLNGGLIGDEIERGFKYLTEKGFLEGDNHILTETGYEAMP